MLNPFKVDAKRNNLMHRMGSSLILSPGEPVKRMILLLYLEAAEGIYQLSDEIHRHGIYGEVPPRKIGK